MKTQRLQANFARKRETEHLRMEKTNANNQYFQNWSKVTTHFENWTAPEYYEQAEKNLQKDRERQLKNVQLEKRRQKLRTLLEGESKMYEEEMDNSKKRKSRTSMISTDTLEKIDKNLQKRSEERRRLELESKLYSRLRHGTIDDSKLFDAKSNNEILAKMNWLDKQIENQIQMEQEEKENELRRLRLHEEATKREEYLKERQKIRESEIKELRSIQEKNVEELKTRENECSLLQKEEIGLRNFIEEFQTELNSLCSKQEIEEQYNSNNLNNHSIRAPNNVNKIKMFLRKSCSIYHKELRKDIELLKRINTYCDNVTIENLIEQYERMYREELFKETQISSMYESEAKSTLNKWEGIWKKDSTIRKSHIINLLKKQLSIFESKLNENVKQQKHLIEIQQKHLNVIENTNEKLKLVVKENEDSKQLQVMKDKCSNIDNNENIKEEGSDAVRDKGKKENHIVSKDFSRQCRISDIFSDGSDNGNGMSIQLNSARQQEKPPSWGPKFGRKKVAWT